MTAITNIKQPEPIEISARGLFIQNNIFDRLKFAYAIAPLRTKRAFKKVGIEIEGLPDLANIAMLSQNGFDKAGVKMRDNKIYAYNTDAILKKIFDDKEPSAQSAFVNAPITFTDVVMVNGKPQIV